MSAAPVSFADMARFALNEASRIEITQAALVKFGDIKQPHPDALRNKEICEALVRLINACRDNPIIKKQLMAIAKVAA